MSTEDSNTRVYHQIGDRKLRDWHTIEIVDAGETWEVFITSRIHVNKRIRIGPSWGKEFTHAQILHSKEVARGLFSHYGKDAACCPTCGR